MQFGPAAVRRAALLGCLFLLWQQGYADQSPSPARPEPSLPPSSNWNAPFVPVALPGDITREGIGIRAATIGPDDYAYVGSAAGVYRAPVPCIAANPANVGCWSALNYGAPVAIHKGDPYLAVTSFDFVAGKVVATWVDPHTGHHGRVCSWDPARQTWICNKSQNPDPFELGTGVVTHDGNNNLYAGARSIYKSSDGGMKWADQTRGDAYGKIGLKTGYIFDIKVWGGSIYWGGEGPLIRQPLDFSSFQNLLPTSNGGCTDCYAHNMRGTIADGDAAVGAQTEIIALINHCGAPGCPNGSGYIQRLDVASNQWSPASDAKIPEVGTSLYWTIRRLAKGPTPHEYYAVGGSSGGVTGVLGSLDGGATWTLLGNSQTWSAPNNPSALSCVGVSTLDDSKIAARLSDMWFQPGPAGVRLPH